MAGYSARDVLDAIWADSGSELSLDEGEFEPDDDVFSSRNGLAHEVQMAVALKG